MPILKPGELDIISYSAEQTGRLGARLGTLLQAGDVLCLSGDMGAGKTVFSAGVGRGWGAQTPLTSPTFNLVHQHQRARDASILYHLDFYRIHSAGDAESIGLDEIFDGSGPVLLEWPEHILDLLPREYLWVRLRILEPTRRNLIFEAHGARYEALLEQFRGMSYGTA